MEGDGGGVLPNQELDNGKVTLERNRTRGETSKLPKRKGGLSCRDQAGNKSQLVLG